ncbi:MarR family transcriptional regulator [Curtobacterium sp. MCBD17_040]|uniref:MarR family winged helix-turn-helix transcriptional regulator n=1 Tax=Curtobacterium sp. MCBD17_040 TaxID=2175674 RepID=UPI000DA85376|nr:MarR family transcriptional regulator [Curtobacterium sp. MCBD17_040]WIB63279.1 MarR family transcriptional regulator [Curtobacterium sp. MCBD17_040]
MTERSASDIDLAEALIAVHGRFRRTLLVAKTDEISPTQSAVIGRLLRDGPQTTADLARAEGVRPQSMGATIAGLVELGLAVREPHPTDGRRALVQLTTVGREARAGSHASRTRLVADRLAGLPAEDRAAVERAIDVLGSLVDP